MPIPIDCTCGRRVEASDKFAGKSVRCTYCGRTLEVPGSIAPPISVTCACGKALKAPASMAGKKAKCPSCGASVAIPSATDEAAYELLPEAPRTEPPPDPIPPPSEAPRRRVASGADRPLIQTQVPPLPPFALGLAGFSILDSILSIVVAGLLVLASTLASVVIGAVEQQQKAAESADAKAEAAVERIKREGGTVSLNMDERGRDGGRVRRIEFLTAAGEKKTELIPLGDAPESKLSRQELEQAKALKQKGLWIGLVGVLLGLTAVGKIVCAGGVFLRRDWGRAGLVLFSALEAVFVVAAVATGGVSLLLLASLLSDGVNCVYFLSGRVRAACPY